MCSREMSVVGTAIFLAGGKAEVIDSHRLRTMRCGAAARGEEGHPHFRKRVGMPYRAIRAYAGSSLDQKVCLSQSRRHSHLDN
jgi:hypothetical protein